jgi:hypothetical protein
MTIMRRLFRIIGIVALLMGLLWVGQGLGIVRWPASSAMIDARPWVWRGAALAFLGLLLILRPRLGRR